MKRPFVVINEYVRAAAIAYITIMLGKRTSQFGKKEFSEWLEYLHFVAADRGVVLDGRRRT